MSAGFTDFNRSISKLVPSVSGRLTLAETGSAMLWLTICLGSICLMLKLFDSFVPLGKVMEWSVIVITGLYIIIALTIHIRRLHDAGHSGAWVLLCLFGLGIFPTMMSFGDSVGDNQYGLSPKNNPKHLASFDDLVGGFRNMKISFTGRISRREFNAAFIALSITSLIVNSAQLVYQLVFSLAGFGLAMKLGNFMEYISLAVKYIPLALDLCLFISLCGILTRRLHDSGRKPIPLVLFIVTIIVDIIVSKLSFSLTTYLILFCLSALLSFVITIVLAVFSQADTEDADTIFGVKPEETRL